MLLSISSALASPSGFCNDDAVKYDLGSQYFDSVKSLPIKITSTSYELDDIFNESRLYEWTNHHLKVIKTSISGLSPSGVGCNFPNTIKTLMLQRNMQRTGLVNPTLCEDEDCDNFANLWDWAGFFWDDDTEEVCYIRQHTFEVFYDCIDGSSIASILVDCPGSDYV